MAVDWPTLFPQMLAASKAVLKKKWPAAKDYAESELQKLAETLRLIEKLTSSGKINEAEARLQLQIQRNAARTVLLTLEGLGMLAAEEAINAALNVVKAPVNAALGFTLI
ncbi:MAG: hypothetical protein HY700_05270 [Gemmatimonadetes bacterium]|nr:hypothetical protein [Gemmatimonadota bacterium]